MENRRLAEMMLDVLRMDDDLLREMVDLLKEVDQQQPPLYTRDLLVTLSRLINLQHAPLDVRIVEEKDDEE